MVPSRQGMVCGGEGCSGPFRSCSHSVLDIPVVDAGQNNSECEGSQLEAGRRSITGMVSLIEPVLKPLLLTNSRC